MELITQEQQVLDVSSGESSGTIEVPIYTDSDETADETATLTLNNAVIRRLRRRHHR